MIYMEMKMIEDSKYLNIRGLEYIDDEILNFIIKSLISISFYLDFLLTFFSLDSLPELERENILMERHERRQEIQRKIARLRNEGRLRERKSEDKLPEIGQQALRNATLNELKQKRIEQKERRKKIEENNQTQNQTQNQNQTQTRESKKKQVDNRSEVFSYENEIPYEEPQKEIRIPPLLDLLHITLSKNAIQAWMNLPYFKNVIKNCFIKYHTTLNSVNLDSIDTKFYKYGEIADIEDFEPYEFGSKTVYHGLRVIVGDLEELIPFSQTSNQPITQEDYSYWVQQCYESHSRENRFPTQEKILEKAKRLAEVQQESQNELLRLKAENRKYTIDDNIATLTRVISECRIDLSHSDIPEQERRKKEQLLEELTTLLEAKKMTFISDAKVKINDKIKMNKVVKVPIKSAPTKTNKTVRSGDPFSRIESQGSSVYIAGSTKNEEKNDDKTEISNQSIDKEASDKKRTIDAKVIVSAHDFDLGIDLDDLGAI